MANAYRSFSTKGFVESVAGQDVLAKLATDNGWTDVVPARFTEIFATDEVEILINGFSNTLLAGSELQIDAEMVESLVTVDADRTIYVKFVF